MTTNTSNETLIAEFHQLVRSERKITLQVLQMIGEIDRRKIFLARAYPSLFEFLTKEFGYSAGAAMRRIESARLLNEVPAVAENLASGSLNLSHLSHVAQAVRRHEQQNQNRVSSERKAELLQKAASSVYSETPAILAQELDLEVLPTPKKIVHRDRSVTISLTFTEEQMAEIQKAQDDLSHALSTRDVAELLLHLCRKQSRPKIASSKSANFLTRKVTASTSARKVSPSLRQTILQTRDCEFRDPQKGKVCGSTSFKQVDHIRPRWAGGTNDAENLRVLCGAHNRWRYRQQSNQRVLLPVRKKDFDEAEINRPG